MKKIVRLFAGLLIPIFSASALNAANTKTLDQLRAMQIADYIQNEYNMIARADAYILKTADTTPTRGEIQSLFGLSVDFWDNFEKQQCANTNSACTGNTGAGVNFAYDLTKKTYTLSNTIGSSPNTYVIKAYQNDNDNSRSVDSSNNVTFSMSAKVSNLLDLVVEISKDPNAYIGLTAPTDTTKTWYQPDGNGGFIIKKYNSTTGLWDKVGTTATSGGGKIYAKTLDELYKIPCLPGDVGYVTDDIKAVEYTCTSDGTWKIAGTSSSGGLFNGDAKIEQMIRTLMSKDGGSIATSSAPNAEFAGAKDFTKKSSVGSNGYWVAENIYVATDKLSSLLTQSWSINAYAWLPRPVSGLYTLQKKTVPLYGDHWVYIAKGYDDVAGNFNNIDTTDGGIVYDTKNSKFFTRLNNVWTSTDGFVKLTAGVLGRGEFSSTSGVTYYVSGNDCDTTTCNGVNGSYAGVLYDNMYVYYYSASGNRKNNLIDAIPRATMTEIYNNQDAAALYGGYVYLKDVDNRGRLCYKRTTGEYVTKTNIVIPTGNNMPPSTSGTCSNAAYSGSAIILTNRTEMADWTDAPLTAQAQVVGNTYTFTNGASNDHYWKSAAEWVTNGSRSDFDMASPGTVKYLSKQVGTEPNYTGTGVTASVDVSFKEWFYSATGTINVINPCWMRCCYHVTLQLLNIKHDTASIFYDGVSR